MRFSLLLSAFLLLVAGTVPAMRADAASVGSIEIQYNDAKFDVWEAVSTKDEIGTDGTGWNKALIVTSNGKYATAFIGSGNLDDDYINLTDLSTYDNTKNGGKYNPDIYTYCIKNHLNDDAFYTAPGAITGVVTLGNDFTDNDNAGQPRVTLELGGKILMGDVDLISDADFEYEDDWDDLSAIDDDWQWTILTPDKQSGGSFNATSKGRVAFVCPIAARNDCSIKDNGSQLLPNETKGGSLAEYRMYFGWTLKVPAITKDYTVTAGNTVSLTDGAVLADGVKLTIEPGAVVSVESTFYNNGTIENYGTLIVSDGGQIRQIATTDTHAGTINCYGGGYKVKSAATGKALPGEGVFAIMNKGAVFFQHDFGSLYLYGGALVQNYGTMELPDGCVVKDSEFINNGTVTTGIKTATVSPTGNSKKSYINCDNGESFIENGGSWNNYSIFVDSGNSHITNVNGSSANSSDINPTTTTTTRKGGGPIDDVLR